MGAIQDVTAEFHSASPGQKALMLVAIVAVAGVAYYVYRNKVNGSSSSQGTLVPVDLTGSSGTDTSGGSTGTTSTPTPTPTPTRPFTVTITQAIKNAFGGHTLHDIAAFYGISYQDLYNANKSVLGNDPNHAKYGVGTVLTIPNPTKNIGVLPGPTNTLLPASTALTKMPLLRPVPQSAIQQNVSLNPK